VRALIERERPGAIFYVAYDKADRAITVDGAEAAARGASAVGARFLLTSTDLVYDGRTGNYNENMPATPMIPYGQLKIEAENAVRGATSDPVILRPSLMCGESGIMMQPTLECSTLMRGQVLTSYADEWRSPVHVDDVARACWDLVSTAVGGTFHCGGPDRLSRVEIARIVCRMFKFDASLIRETPRPEDRPRDTSLDSRRLASFLGWAPRSLKVIEVIKVIDATKGAYV
jgi:dTDP-4-dehydrorhamnose reductase